MEQPEARVEKVYDTYFGRTVEDPYRWMEDWQGTEAQAWLSAQASYTKEYLHSLPEREALLARVRELGENAPIFCDFTMRGGRIFYLRRDPRDELARLVVYLNANGQEKTLFDPNMIEGKVHLAIDWYSPSYDGRYVAYGVSYGGSEQSTLYVLDVDSGEMIDSPITRARFARLGWLNDHRSFVYYRLPERSSSVLLNEYYSDGGTYLHYLGDDPSNDQAVFGRGINPQVEISSNDFPFLHLSSVSDWMIGMVVHGTRGGMTLYAAPQKMLQSPTTCTWIKITDSDDTISGFDFVGDTIYLRTSRDAPRFKVLATSIEKPDLANASVIVPESAMVIKGSRVTDKYLLTRDLDGGIWRMRRIKLDDGQIESVPLPFEGTITEWANEEAGAEVLLFMTSWTVSPRLFRYNVTTGIIEDTGICPPSSIDFSDIEVREAHVPSCDGIRIPLSILHKKGLPLDGKNPTLIKTYGAYGFTIDPFFSPAMLAWYERGGIYALAHVRGGGEYGKEWHLAGMKLNKQNTIDDFIACAKYLISEKYTSTNYLSGDGSSAGSIPCAGALVQRPDLWAAMVMHGAVTNALRFELTESGPPNISELGSVSTEEGFRSLQIIEAYSKVQQDIPYPAVLFTVGLFDTRVAPWQSMKMVARLQKTTASGKSILLRIDEQGGHDIGSTKRQLDEELADRFAFLLHQFDMNGHVK